MKISVWKRLMCIEHKSPDFARQLKQACPDGIGIYFESVGGKVFDDYGYRYDEFAKEMSQWLSTGQIKYREHMIDGLENAPSAFIGMLGGKNFRKLVIRVND